MIILRAMFAQADDALLHYWTETCNMMPLGGYIGADYTWFQIITAYARSEQGKRYANN